MNRGKLLVSLAMRKQFPLENNGLENIDTEIKICNNNSIVTENILLASNKETSEDQDVIGIQLNSPQFELNFNDVDYDIILENVVEENKSTAAICLNEESKEKSLDSNHQILFEESSEREKITDAENKKTRKRARNPQKWKDQIKKTARNSGKQYKTRKGILKKSRSMGRGCKENCYLKCLSKFSQETRERIFKDFWDINELNEKRAFIQNHISFVEKKTVVVKTATTSRRNLTYNYFLPSAVTTTERVCKKMFLETLDINDQWIKTILNKLKESNIITTELRGILPGKNCISEEIKKNVRTHINSFPRMESHYCRKQTSREYFESGLNISKLHRLFKDDMLEKNIKDYATKRQYSDIFNQEFNIGFFSPKKDQCDKCQQYILASPEEKSKIQKNYESHIKIKDAARKKKDSHKDASINNPDKIACFCFDMQKVLITPFSEVGIFYYKRKLSTYNFSAFDLGKREAFCFVWNETVAKRGSNEISSCLYNLINKKVQDGITDFYLWADNCGGQNKNRIVFATLMYLSATHNISITLSFLETGHTQNENDSVHATIERQSKGKTIYIPEQWYFLIGNAKQEGRKYEVQEMTKDEFLNLKELLNIGNWNSNLNLKWNKIRQISIEKNNPFILNVKFDFSDDLAEQFRMMENNVSFPKIFPAFSRCLPIAENKYKDLISLCKSGCIPKIYHGFFENLKYNTTNSKCTNDDDSVENIKVKKKILQKLPNQPNVRKSQRKLKSVFKAKVSKNKN